MAGRASPLLASLIAAIAIFTTSHPLAASPPWEKANSDAGSSQGLDLYTVVMTAAVLIGATIVVVLFNAEQKRRRDLQALAASRGVVFQLRAGAVDKDLLVGTELWHAGHGGSASIGSILEFPATEELDLLVFEYSHSTGSGVADNTSSMLYYTVEWMDSPLLRLPKFFLRPASILNIATKPGGFGGLNFPSHPNFLKHTKSGAGMKQPCARS